jgi:hypothetical protein|tara:strand:- start:924 stop:1142 length:219 start_codon:yes stop_codon:yes gene_type:complete
MKFALIIWVCSFLGNQAVCMPPMEYPKQFDSWYECSRTAHKESLLLISKMGFKYINEHQMAIKYSCIKGPSI